MNDNHFPYIEADVVNGQLVAKNVAIVNQAKLTSDCWMVQFKGFDACKTCEYRGTKECGGGATLKRMKAQKRV